MKKNTIFKYSGFFLFILRFTLLDANDINNQNIKKNLIVIYPYLTSVNIQNLKLKNNKGINGSYNSTNLLNYDLFIGSDNNEQEYKKFISLINNVKISKEYIEATLTFKDGSKEKMLFLNTIIGNTKPYYYHKIKNSYNLDDIKVLLKKEDTKDFKIELTKEEQKFLKYLFFNKEEIKYMWFIYKNFSTFYQKDFTIFNSDGKIMSLEEGRSFFLRILRIFVYNSLYEGLY